MRKLSGRPVSALTTEPRRAGCWAAASCAVASSSRCVIADARGESRTLMGLPPTDFESVASAIPPLGPIAAREIYLGKWHAAPPGESEAGARLAQSVD